MYEAMWYDWATCSVDSLAFKKCDRLSWVYSMLWIASPTNRVNEWITRASEHVETCVQYKNYMCAIVYSVHTNKCIEVSGRHFRVLSHANAIAVGVCIPLNVIIPNWMLSCNRKNANLIIQPLFAEQYILHFNVLLLFTPFMQRFKISP